MKPVLSVKQMQSLDKRAISELGIPDIVLMENAGRSSWEVVQQLVAEHNLSLPAVIGGKGNNGGDAFVVARHLWQAGLTPDLYLTADPLEYKGSAATNLKIVLHLGMEPIIIKNLEDLPDLRDYDLIIDGLLGTGVKGVLTGLLKALVATINDSNAHVVSIDIPSGIMGNSGELAGSAVIADDTITMCTPKRGLLLPPGSEHTGRLHDAYIGFLADDFPDAHSWYLLETEDVRELLPVRNRSAHKGDLGKVIAVAGSRGLTGAAILSAGATLIAGCGMTTLMVPESLNLVIETALPEVMTVALPDADSGYLVQNSLSEILDFQHWGDQLLIGPGLGRHTETMTLVQTLIREAELPIVIDADGLYALARAIDVLYESEVPICLTPHHGEFLRLIGKTEFSGYEEIIEAGIAFATEYAVTLVLKGAPTAVITPEGEVMINSSGNPGMATAGSGDVLAGLISGLSAQGLHLTDAAITGVHLHGLAGDLAAETRTEFSLIAGDLIKAVPGAFARLLHDES